MSELAGLNHVRRGSGPPLLLLHSLGGQLTVWTPVLDRLAAERDVVAVDMPGFGASPGLPEGVEYTAANIARAVLDFCRGLGFERPGAAGISLGAWVGIECARQGGASAAVALCPAGFWREPLEPAQENAARRVGRLLAPVIPFLLRTERGRRRALESFMVHPERVPAADAIRLARGYVTSTGYDEASATMRSNVVAALDEVEVPVTIGWAEHDRLVRSKPLPAGVLPDSVRQVALPGCGHVPTWDDPELVSRVILEGTRLRRDSREAIGEDR